MLTKVDLISPQASISESEGLCDTWVEVSSRWEVSLGIFLGFPGQIPGGGAGEGTVPSQAIPRIPSPSCPGPMTSQVYTCSLPIPLDRGLVRQIPLAELSFVLLMGEDSE